MIAFHMLCHEDAAKARKIARGPFDLYFQALNECAGEWATGTTSKDYRDYDKQAKSLVSATLETQIESGGAWVGSPDQIIRTIQRLQDTIGKFEHASLQVNFGNLDYRSAQQSLQMFCTHVLPKFSL
jgi:alkanesulfonate monooxygenase SsuD/methylene tetrahydromethanopterin reductase-like flavin-dependent oxidoreductase (luciferase family)